MANDNGGSLVISIKAFTEDVAAGFDNVAAKCRQWAGSVKDSFAGVNAVSNQTSAALVADTNAAAEGVTVAWKRVAEATVAYRQAQREVRNASRDTIALAAGEESAVNRLATAKQRLATATAELASAQKAAVPAAEEETAALATMADVLGPLVEGALILEYINHLKETSLEAAHMAKALNISVLQITELKDAMAAAGVSSEKLPQQLTKLTQQIAAAANGSKAAQHEFHQLGIETDAWKENIPGTLDVFLDMSRHLQGLSQDSREAAAATHLIGRGSLQMVGWMKDGDDAIKKQMAAFQAHAQAVAANVEAAQTLQRTELQLKTSLETSLLPVFGLLVKGIVSVIAAWDLAEGAFEVAKEYFKSWVAAVSTGIREFKNAIDDLATGGGIDRFTKLAKKAVDDMSKDILKGANNVEKIWDDAFAKANSHFQTFTDALDKGEEKIVGDAKGHVKNRIADWQDGLVVMKLQADEFHAVTLKRELEYYENLKSISKQTKEEKDFLDRETLRLKKAITKETFDDEISKMNLALAATKSGSQQRIALLQNDLIQLRNEGKQETAAYKEKEKELTEAKKQYAEERNRISQQLELEEAQFEEKIALLQLQARKDAFGAEVTAHHKKDKDVLQQEKEFAAEEHRIIVAGINAKLKVLEKDPTLNVLELKRLHNQLLIEDQRFSNELNKIQEKSVNRRLTLEQSLAQGMKSSMNSAVTGLIKQTETLSQAFEQMGESILSSLVDMFDQMVVSFIEREILMKVFHLATEKEKAVSGVAASAAQAGAAGVASWAGAPWPIDAGAPAFGAAMFSTAMAYQAAGFAAKGALVPKDMPIFAHAEEMILPAPLSRGIQGMISGGGTGGGITISPTLNASAMDTNGLVPVLNSFKRQLIRELKAAVANNRLNLKTV